MSTRCLICIVRDDPASTPERVVILTVGLIKAHSVETLESHLCPKHRRALDTVLSRSTAMLRKILSP